LKRHTHNGFAYTQEPSATSLFQPQVLTYGLGGTYMLSNIRRDAYHGLDATLRHTFGDQYEWMASYVRSRAVSNAVLAPGVDIPLQVTPATRPVPWDTTNRILSWGYLPVYPKNVAWLKNWAWAYLLDYRTGFAFSVANQAGIISGPVDSYRFPANLDLNLHVERRFIFRGYRFALRGGVNNLTNSRNPTAVNSTLGSPQFLQFLGDEGRHFEFRLRFFGKKGTATP
jgi:CubicO group peptidase (beta-lactamase class C family)